MNASGAIPPMTLLVGWSEVPLGLHVIEEGHFVSGPHVFTTFLSVPGSRECKTSSSPLPSQRITGLREQLADIDPAE